jgi:hypothetical protein
MYKFSIIDINTLKKPVLFCQCFVTQKDIITFTKGKVTYNDFRTRKSPKKYKTFKNYFVIEKI